MSQIHSSHQESGTNPISGASVFTMSDYVSLGCWYNYISHSSSHPCNDDKISEEKIIQVSSGEEILGHRYLKITHYFSCNSGGHVHRHLDTRYSSSRNHRGYHSSDFGGGGSRSQEIIH